MAEVITAPLLLPDPHARLVVRTVGTRPKSVEIIVRATDATGLGTVHPHLIFLTITDALKISRLADAHAASVLLIAQDRVPVLQIIHARGRAEVACSRACIPYHFAIVECFTIVLLVDLSLPDPLAGTISAAFGFELVIDSGGVGTAGSARHGTCLLYHLISSA